MLIQAEISIPSAACCADDGGHGGKSGRQGEHAGGARAMLLAFGGKVALLVGGLALLRLDPPLLAKDFLYSERWGRRHGRHLHCY